MKDRTKSEVDSPDAAPESRPGHARERGANTGGASESGVFDRDALLTEVQRIAGLGGFVWMPGDTTPIWSDEFYRILGYEPGSITPGLDAFLATVHPADLELVRNAWNVAQTGTMPDLEYRIVRHSTKELRFVRGSGRVYMDNGGKVVRIVGALQDITDAKRSAVAHQEALAIARAAERASGTGSFVVRLEPMEVLWTEGLTALAGLDPPNTDLRAHVDRVHPEDRDKQATWWDRLIRERCCEPLSIRVVRPDGSVRHVYTQTALVRLGDGVERVVGTSIDVTERVLLEEQLRHAAKMEAVGTLAAGIAHDFNNYLMVMDSSLSMLDDSSESERQELIEAGRLALDRCMELTRQLLAFARREPFRPEVVELTEVVLQFQELLHRAVGRRATLRLDLGRRPLRARVDPRHVERMLTNLVVNAADAIEDTGSRSGRVTVRLDAVTLDSTRRMVPADVPAGSYACIVVEDEGGGIENARLSRIFDPYFTTKPHGRGTGLGLASVYGMARQNRAQVSVEGLDGGTRFTLWFPRVEGASPQSRQQSTDPGAPQGDERGDVCVLVVDDVDQVRDIAARILRSAGFRTLTAQHGAEALDVLDAGHDVGLVLTDLQMPVMSGRQLAEQLRSRPNAPPVIFMTGYSEETHGQSAEPGLRLLNKPFTPDHLVDFVREALSAHSRSGRADPAFRSSRGRS